MKHTKNMVYTPSVESQELILYAIHERDVYRIAKDSIVPNLRKKWKKGIYNTNKAVDCYYRVATTASEKYNREFGYKFTVTERFTAAVELEEYFREEVES